MSILLLQIPDELFRHIMEYAGLRAACNLAATCSTIRSFLDVDKINRNVRKGVVSYHCYSDDDDGVRIARYIDVCYRYVVKHPADTASATYCHIKNIFTTFNHNVVDVNNHFVRKHLLQVEVTAYSYSVDRYNYTYSSGYLPVTRAVMYRATAMHVMRAIIALFKLNMWTLNPSVPTKLQKLFMTDMTTPYDDVPSYYLK